MCACLHLLSCAGLSLQLLLVVTKNQLLCKNVLNICFPFYTSVILQENSVVFLENMDVTDQISTFTPGLSCNRWKNIIITLISTLLAWLRTKLGVCGLSRTWRGRLMDWKTWLSWFLSQGFTQFDSHSFHLRVLSQGILSADIGVKWYMAG